MLGAGVETVQSWFCARWDGCCLLYACVIPALLIWVALMAQHSFSRRNRTQALPGSRLRRRGTQDEEEGAETQPCGPPCRDSSSSARRAARLRSIRQLLCDDAGCALCKEVAWQAERLVEAERAGAWVPAGRGSPPPPAASPQGWDQRDVCTWRGLEVLPVHEHALPPAWGPFPAGQTHSPPERQAGSWQTEHLPPGEDGEGLPDSQQAGGSSREQDEYLCCSSRWDETLLRWQEQGQSQAERGWGGTFLSCSRARSPQVAPQRQAHGPGRAPFGAESQGRARMSGWEAKQQQDQESAAARAAGEALGSLAVRAPARGRIEFTAAETPFILSDVRARLEWHVQVRRLQHALGLPVTLQRSLKIFMPPAPKSARRRHQGAVRVVTVPRALPFMSVGCRAELERHLERMVQLKRWGLPKRIQESLRLLRPAARPHSLLGPLPSGPGRVRTPQTPSPRARASKQPPWGTARVPEPVPGLLCCRETQELPFLLPGAREELEWHIQRRRLQHALGLPVTLQRSLKIFMPPAPKSARRRHQGAVRVVTVPRALPFMSVGCRAELERHLERMVQLKRWGLPKRIQESLRMLRPAARPRSLLGPLPSGLGRVRTPQTPSPRARAPERPPWGTTGAPGSTPGLLCCRETRELHGHVARKALEIQLGALPAVLRGSEKMAALGRRTLLLPKLIPPGWKAPLARGHHRLCPQLQRKAASVELNVRHKHIQFLWALPTLYVESLSKMVPCPPVHPAPLPSLGVAIEFQDLGTPFVAPEPRELLERHVLRKRLQHEWGLPGLVQRSLGGFMPPPPMCPRPQGSIQPAATELRVSGEIPAIPLATAQELEAHIRRRVAKWRWGLPRRVQESLRGFMPPAPSATGTRLDTRGRPFYGLSRRRAPRKSPPWGAPVRSTVVAVSLAGPPGAAQSQELSWDTHHQLLERHMARKSVEIRLGLIAPRAHRSQEAARRVGKLPLPRLLWPGQRSLDRRPRGLLFLEQAASDRLELNVIHKHLSWTWGLPSLYRRSLAKLLHGAPSPALPPGSTRAVRSEFAAQGLPFLPPGAREVLEWHVQRKKLHHEWGLPLLIQKSMRGLLAAPPRPSQPRAPPPAHREVAVLQTELSFLSEGSRMELELSLRKRLMHRRWGLPRRIQESVRLLRPATAPAEFAEQVAQRSPLPLWHRSAAQPERGVGKAGRAVAAPPPWLSLGRAAQEQLELHMAKKCLETRLGALPAAVRCSWTQLRLVSWLPLPKLIPAGEGPPKARSPLLPFIRLEDVCQLEQMVQRKHLMALWGLGSLYAESLSRMVPRAPPGTAPPHKAQIEFSAWEAPCIGPETREALELHIRKKRLQHEWGFPALIKRSLRAFVPETPPPGPSAPRWCTELHVHIRQQEPSLIDQGTRRRLELHVQKMRLQRMWGLPQRIQESLRLFAAFAPPAGPRLPVADGERGAGRSWRGPRQPHSPAESRLGGASRSEGLSVERRAKLQGHLMRKCVEIRLGVWPALVRRSQKTAGEGERTRLARLIRAGQKPPQPRAGSLLFLPPAAVAELDMNVRHKHLAFLWGLPTRLMELWPVAILSGLAPPALGLASRGQIEFQEADAPFLEREAREMLERHVLRRRMQHDWGVPSTVLRSLKAFVPPPPALAERAHRPVVGLKVGVRLEEMSFVSEPMRRDLEAHVRRIRVHHRWGVPRRIRESLGRFVSPAPPPSAPLARSQEAEVAGGASRRRGTDARATDAPARPLQMAGAGAGAMGPSVELMTGPAPAARSAGHGLSAPERSRLETHITRKCLEIKFQLMRWPRGPAGPAAILRRLPKPVHLSPAWQAKPRTTFLPCLEPGALEKLELNIRHKSLAQLWGLPTLQAVSLRRMVPKAPVVPSAVAAGGALAQMGLAGGVRAEEPERDVSKRQQGPAPLTPASAGELPAPHPGLPLVTDEARGRLENHILRKKLQHEWGLPSLVQRSLGAFAPPSPGKEAPRQHQAPARVSVPTGSLLFLGTETRERLESHVRRLALERKWGLPKRIQESLRRFLPPALPLLHVFSKPPRAAAAPSRGQSGEMQPGPSEPLAPWSQHWHEMGVTEGKASGAEAAPQRSLVGSSRRSQETSWTSYEERSPGPTQRLSPEQPSGPSVHLPEDKAQLKSSLDFHGKKVLGIPQRAPESKRQAPRPAAPEPHPERRERSSDETSRHQRILESGGAPWLAGTGERSQSSSVDTAVWNKKRISRELESSFKRMAGSRSHWGLAPEILVHLRVDHCSGFSCPCCKLEGRDGTHSLGAGSPAWQRQRGWAGRAATLPRDAAAPRPPRAEPAWQGQGAPSTAQDVLAAPSPSSLGGSESRASDWSAGESADATSRSTPEEPLLVRVHIPLPPAATHWLDTHLVQRALGSFILPPCVIRSQAAYDDMAAERARGAAQERRLEMSIRLRGRRGQRSQLRGPRRESRGERTHPTGTGQPGFPTAGALGQRLITGSHSRENRYPCETCRGLSTAGEEGSGGPPCPAVAAGKSEGPMAELETGVGPRHRETSSDDSRALSGGEQGASYQQSQELWGAAGGLRYDGPAGTEDGEGAGGQTWAPPVCHSQPVARADEGERGSSAACDDLSCAPSSSWGLASLSGQRPQSAEGLSQFSTEAEWEMVGDWDSEALAAWDTEGEDNSAWKESDTKGGRGGVETLAEGTGPRAGSGVRQAESLVLTAAPPMAEQLPCAPLGSRAEPPSTPCQEKGPTVREIMLGFLRRVTSGAPVGKRGQADGLAAAPHRAPPPPQKLVSCPKNVTFSAQVHVRAEVRGGQLGASGEEMGCAGRNEPSSAARTSTSSTDTKQGEQLKGSVAGGAGHAPGERLQRQEHAAGVWKSGSAALDSNQPSPGQSSRAGRGEQSGQGLRPSPRQGRSRCRVKDTWSSSRGTPAGSRYQSPSSTGRPTSRRTRSRSREQESLEREGRAGAHRRPGKADSHGEATPAPGVGGNATQDASATAGASNLERCGPRAVVEIQLLPLGTCPGKSADRACRLHEHGAQAHLRDVHDRPPALCGENLRTLRERVRARRRELSTSLDSAASAEEGHRLVSYKS